MPVTEVFTRRAVPHPPTLATLTETCPRRGLRVFLLGTLSFEFPKAPHFSARGAGSIREL